MITFVSFLLAVIGFLFIALTQKRPRISLVKGAPIKRVQVNVYRILASLSLGVSFFLEIAYEGWSFGIIVWGTMISIAALFVSFSITIMAPSEHKSGEISRN
tara:strand:+ start:2224 stop:2529 length:306 start_codon:yes stop_codon:yes gene_type:complete